MDRNEFDNSTSNSCVDKYNSTPPHSGSMFVKRLEWIMLAGSLLLGAAFLIVIAFE